jgi:hypothetical protein
MTHRSLRSALAGRGFMLLPAAAFAVHQLRYELGYGSRADQALAAQGHGYLDSLAPWVAVLIAFAFGSFLVRLANAASGRPALAPRRAFGQLWLVTSAALLGLYSTQEALEGVFAAGHPGGLEGVFGHGGWWAVLLSLAFGLVVAVVLRLGAAAVDLVTKVRLTVLAANPHPVGALRIRSRRRSALAGASAGRAPPATYLARA